MSQKTFRAPFGDTWLKTIKCFPIGLPRCLKEIRKELVTDPKAVIQITSLVRLLKLKPSHDISSITEPSLMAWPPLWKDDFGLFLDQNLQTIDVEAGEWHASTKAGPNGPAIIAAGADALAIEKAGLLDQFKDLCSTVNESRISDKLELLLKDVKDKGLVNNSKRLDLAKLSYLSDKAGKTRVVYILNYWMQELLLPLHSAMMKWLRKQSQDGTFDQQKAVETVKHWTKEGKPLWSFDLTAATDRWPKAHQMLVIQRVAGPSWSHVWDWVLDINPYSEPHKRTVAYSVGQPMGAYASWASLAMTHHMLIRWCASRIGVDWNCYVVLGDDVVISNDKVAKLYEQSLHDLGVTISPGKSIVWENQIVGSSAEFAKQTLFNGDDLSAISPQLLVEIWDHHQWWKVLDLFQELKEKYGLLIYSTSNSLSFPTLVKELLESLPKDSRTFLPILIGDPQGPRCLISKVKEVLGLESRFDIPNPWAEVDELTYLTVKCEMIGDQVSEKASRLIELRDSLTKETGGNIPVGWLIESPNHPIWAIIDRLDEAARTACKHLANCEIPSDYVDLLMDVDFLNNLLTKGIAYKEWKDNKSRKLKVQCTFSKRLHHKATNLEEWYY